MQSNRSLILEEIRAHKLESSSEASFTFYNSQQCLEKFAKQFEFPVDLEKEIQTIKKLSEAILWLVLPIEQFMEVIQRHISNAASVVNCLKDLIPEGKDKNLYTSILGHINRRVENIRNRKFLKAFDEIRDFQSDLSSVENGLDACKNTVNKVIKAFTEDFALNLEAIKFEAYIMQLNKFLTVSFEYAGVKLKSKKSLPFLNAQEQQSNNVKSESWNCTLY